MAEGDAKVKFLPRNSTRELEESRQKRKERERALKTRAGAAETRRTSGGGSGQAIGTEKAILQGLLNKGLVNSALGQLQAASFGNFSSNPAKGGPRSAEALIRGIQADREVSRGGARRQSIEGERARKREQTSSRVTRRRSGGGGLGGGGSRTAGRRNTGQERRDRDEARSRRNEESAFGLKELQQRLTIEARFKAEAEQRRRQDIISLIRSLGNRRETSTRQEIFNVAGSPQKVTLKSSRSKDISELLRGLL